MYLNIQNGSDLFFCAHDHHKQPATTLTIAKVESQDHRQAG